MKNLMLVALLSTLFTCQSVFASQEVDGFRGLKWGMTIEEARKIKDLKSESDEKDSHVMYSAKNDQMTIGSARLESLFYTFWNDKFSSVIATVSGKANFNNLKEASEEKFGRCFRPNRFMDKYVCSEARDETTGILLEFNPVSDKGKLMMLSKKVGKEITADSEKSAKLGAAKDF